MSSKTKLMLVLFTWAGKEHFLVLKHHQIPSKN